LHDNRQVLSPRPVFFIIKRHQQTALINKYYLFVSSMDIDNFLSGPSVSPPLRI
jgi:hypothetical protein